MFAKYFRKVQQKILNSDQNDPLEEQKRMVNSILQYVGHRNVFGDEGIRRYTFTSVLLTIIFGGVFIYFGTFSQLMYCLQVLPDKVLSFQAINCLSTTQVPLSKFFFIVTSSKRLKVIMGMSREGLSAIPKNSGGYKRMMDILRNARIVCWLVIVNQAFTHVVYLVFPFFFTIFGNRRYLPTTPGNIYGLIEKYESPYYETTFIITIVATLFSVFNQTGYIVLFVILVAHEIGHFYAICETLNDIHKALYNTSDDNQSIDTGEINQNKHRTDNVAIPNKYEEKKHAKVQNMLRFCIKHHQYLMRYHDEIRELYKVIFGAHFLIMVIVLVTTLQTLNSWGIINTLLTGVTGVMPLVVYCFGGELLISADLALATAAYSCGWEAMRPEEARSLLKLLSSAQRPLLYTAAGIFVMNRETFGDVVQVVYKIYAVFN